MRVLLFKRDSNLLQIARHKKRPSVGRLRFLVALSTISVSQNDIAIMYRWIDWLRKCSSFAEAIIYLFVCLCILLLSELSSMTFGRVSVYFGSYGADFSRSTPEVQQWFL